MTEQQKKDVEEGFSRFSTEEREVLRRAMEQIANRGLDRDGQYAMVLDLILARRRAGQRYDSDSRTDRARRILVGARVPRELAGQVRCCAKARGVSVYRFVVDIITKEIQNSCGGSNPKGGGNRTNV